MGVDTTHELVKKYEPLWEKTDDAVEGEDAVKDKGSTYLPKLEGQGEEYQAYKKRAQFFAASGRTVAGLVGAVRRKDPQVDWPEGKADLLEKITSRGDSLEELIGTVLRANTSVGRIGLLVDAPPRGEAAPFVAVYKAIDIRDWEIGDVDGRRLPIRIHLREAIKVPDPKDQPFGRKTMIRYRVLRLGTKVPSGEGQPDEDLSGADPDSLKYWQEIYLQKEAGSTVFVFQEVIQPSKMGGRAWTKIPFVPINSIDTSIEPTKPPLIDLVNTNLSHYRNSADLEHGLHLSALPTPWAAGFSLEEGELGGKKNELRMGALSAWTTENHEAQAGMLEFSGAGLGSIIEAMDRKEKHMAVLGGRFLEEQKKAQEAAETVKLRLSGDHATLADIAASSSDGLTQMLKLLADWMNIKEEVHLELNRDFQIAGISAEKITALMAAMQAGAFSWSSFFWNLQQGEAIPEGVTEEEEAERIIAGIPGAQPPTAPLELEEEEEELEEEEEEEETEEGEE